MNKEVLFAIAYIVGGVWLGVWELVALVLDRTGKGDYTISNLTWEFEGAGWTAGRYLVLVFFTWLTLHLAFRVLR
jgi:hypothetical protein